MKKQYETPEIVFYKVFISADLLTTSTDQQISTEIGGDEPPTDDSGFGEVDDGF